MTSRTPIRLTPHRGPLATPSTSSESSPTLSTPPSIDVSHCSTAIGPVLDAAILQYRISTLSPPAQHQSRPRFYSWGHEITKQGLFGRSTHPCPLNLVFGRLIYPACDLAISLAGIVTFCLLIWGLLEYSSYVSELPSISLLSRFPVPSPTRALRCHMNPPLCEPRDQHVAVLQFLSEQIQHAKAMSSLSTSLGLPLRAFFEAHRTAIPRVIIRHNLTEPPHLVQEVDILANLTEFFDSSPLDFTSSSFIGRSLTLALDELVDLISEPMVSQGSSTNREHQDAHLHAIYWRTTSNLLLEYSAARPRARRLFEHLYALHQRLSPLVSGYRTVGSIEGRLNTWWWKGGLHRAATPMEDGMQGFASGLEITLDNVCRLIAYLDWITEQLARTTLRDVLKIQHRTGLSSCMMSLQELFAQSKPSTPRRHCFCVNGYGVTSPRPERVEIMIPGSPTVRVGR